MNSRTTREVASKGVAVFRAQTSVYPSSTLAVSIIQVSGRASPQILGTWVPTPKGERKLVVNPLRYRRVPSGLIDIAATTNHYVRICHYVILIASSTRIVKSG